MSRERIYLPTLDGWRGIAVLGVILYHGREQFPGANPLLTRLAAHCYLGVDVFFAISGFLICGLLLREYEETGDISLRRFYIRRFFRILPPYYVSLAAICAAAAFFALPLNFADVPSCLLFYRNYRPLGIDEYGGFYTAHYWTLAIEEHFYLLWPMLLLVVRPKRAGKVAFLLAMMVFSWRVIEGHFHLLAGCTPAGKSAGTHRHQDGCPAVGMPRCDLLPGYSAVGRAYSFFAALVCARVDHSDCSENASARTDVIGRCVVPVTGGEHGHPAAQRVGTCSGMAAAAVDRHHFL